MIRVLIVDDSKTHRVAIRTIVEHGEGFEVVGEAEDGEEGVRRTHELAPQVVLMDVNMPNLDGLAATERIMAERPTPILLMTSAENLERDVALALRATEHGALDLIPKPRDLDPNGPAAKKLVDRLRLLAGVPVISHPRGHTQRRRAAEKDDGRKTGMLTRARRVVAVAASTGGPRALKCFLAMLPERLPAAVAVVQHIDAAFHEGLVRWLDEETPLSVMTPKDGQGVHEGEVLIAPSGFHLELTPDRRAVLSDAPPEGGHRPSGDRLLRTAAQAYGARAVGVVLTGMGEDGARGLLAIHRAGGATFAQDEASSVVYGMPRAAKELGAAREILPIAFIADAVVAALQAI